MKKNKRRIALLSITVASLLFMPLRVLAEEPSLEQGKALAFDRKKGNCLACHAIAGGTLAGNIAPALVAMKLRFPDSATLRSKIWDATQSNPQTVMPPFGRNRILSGDEIDHIINYLYSL